MKMNYKSITINKRKVENSPNIWTLNDTLLSKTWVNEEVSGENFF